MKIIRSVCWSARARCSATSSARLEPSEPSNAQAIFRYIGNVLLFVSGANRLWTVFFTDRLNTSIGHEEALGNQSRHHRAQDYDGHEHGVLSLRDNVIFQAEQRRYGAERQPRGHQHRR